MKLSTPIYLLAIQLLLLLSLFTSCIKEDVSDCPTGLKVYFEYDPATYARTGVNPSEVHRIDLFIFDGGGIFRGVWTDEMPQLAPGYYMELPLQHTGSYRFIAWGNLQGSYTTSPANFVVGQTTFSEALLCLNHLSGEVSGGAPPLFHADKTEPLSETHEQEVHLPLVQAYNTINLTTEGMDQDGNTYRLSVTDSNGKYKFDYSYAADSNFTYYTSCTKDGNGQLLGTLNILKLAADRHPMLEIYNVTEGYSLYSSDLIALLNKIEGVDYGRVHTYDIRFKFVGTEVTIIINNWKVTDYDVHAR